MLLKGTPGLVAYPCQWPVAWSYLMVEWAAGTQWWLGNAENAALSNRPLKVVLYLENGNYFPIVYLLVSCPRPYRRKDAFTQCACVLYTLGIDVLERSSEWERMNTENSRAQIDLTYRSNSRRICGGRRSIYSPCQWKNEGPSKQVCQSSLWPIWLSILSLTRRYEFEGKKESYYGAPDQLLPPWSEFRLLGSFANLPDDSRHGDSWLNIKKKSQAPRTNLKCTSAMSLLL